MPRRWRGGVVCELVGCPRDVAKRLRPSRSRCMIDIAVGSGQWVGVHVVQLRNCMSNSLERQDWIQIPTQNFNRAILYQYAMCWRQTWYSEWHNKRLSKTKEAACGRRVQSPRLASSKRSKSNLHSSGQLYRCHNGTTTGPDKSRPTHSKRIVALRRCCVPDV